MKQRSSLHPSGSDSAPTPGIRFLSLIAIFSPGGEFCVSQQQPADAVLETNIGMS